MWAEDEGGVAAAEVVPDTWRVKNVFDLVPQVPSLIGYQHAGPEVQLRPKGIVSISAKSSDDVREGACLTELWPMIQGSTPPPPSPTYPNFGGHLICKCGHGHSCPTVIAQLQ